MKNSLVLLPIVFLLFVSGCGSGRGHGDRTGTLSVSLTDAPACGFDQVNVTISKVRVHPSAAASEEEDGWREVVLSPPRKIDLLSLTNGVVEPLGTASLAPGHYSQLRLVLLSNTAEAPLNNSAVPTGGTETPLEVASADQSGIKLIHEFDAAEGARVDLILDLDACRSVVQKADGAPLLNPVLSVIPQAVSGAIRGVVGMNLPTGPALSNPRVAAEQAGAVVKSTSPNPDGSFILNPLVQSATAGSYDLVFTADNAAAAVIQSVPVSARRTTTVSMVDAPLLLNPSTIRTVSGSVTPTTATVRAVQGFPPDGPTVEVHSVNTVVDSGGYSMSTPADAPSLGLYGTGALPISLTLRPDVAGRYSLEAAAEGFSPERRPVSLDGSDLTENFSLTP